MKIKLGFGIFLDKTNFNVKFTQNDEPETEQILESGL